MSLGDASARRFVAPAAVGTDKRLRSFITPEGIDLRLRIASAGERAGAFFLDVAIVMLGLVVFSILVALVAIPIAASTTGAGGFNAGRTALDVMGSLWLLTFFFARNFYFMAFELSPRAATPGKRLMGLRVAARNGAALTATAVFARNAMRDLEIFVPLGFMSAGGGWVSLAALIWSGIFALFPLFNRDRLRVGDFVAGTWVVQAPRVALDIDLAARAAEARSAFAFSDAEVEAYGIKELSVLEQVLRRRDDETMAAVAARIRTKLGRTRAHGESNAAFLDAYYVALRHRLESRMLFGRRRRDKHDRG
jgi:uncharacterized RDD family membrane protein YckC